MLTEQQQRTIKNSIEESNRTQYLNNSIIEDVGIMLGYSINEIEEEIEKNEFYPDGGDNGISIHYESSGFYVKSEILNKIFAALYEIVPKNKFIEFVLD